MVRYKAYNALINKGVTDRNADVISKKIVLLLKDGYRPARASHDMVRLDPGWWVNQGFVASCSGHNSGKAADVMVGFMTDAGLREVWIGNYHDEFDSDAHTAASGKSLSVAQQENTGLQQQSYGGYGFTDIPSLTFSEVRQIFRDAVVSVELGTYSKELWHVTSTGADACYDVPYSAFGQAQ